MIGYTQTSKSVQVAVMAISYVDTYEDNWPRDELLRCNKIDKNEDFNDEKNVS